MDNCPISVQYAFVTQINNSPLAVDITYRPVDGEIGVITPYRRQVQRIRQLLLGKGWDRVKVGSVEEFQGQVRERAQDGTGGKRGREE